MAYNEAAKRKHHEHQSESLRCADRANAAWTPEEDAVVRDRSLTCAEAAVKIHRPYYTTKLRRFRLDHGLVPDYLSGRDMVYRHPEAAPLCACGTQDDEHDGWCPVNEQVR